VGPILVVPNVTAHSSTASVLITVLLYNGPLLCDFNVVNSILYGAASKHINRLQRVQNVLARVVTYQRPYSSLSSTALLQNLHWLPIEWRVHFKLATYGV